MIEVRTGRTYYPRIIGGAPEGLVGTLTLALEEPDNTVIEEPSTEGIVETSDGAYTGTRIAPETAGTYIVVWYDPGEDVSLTEELLVTASAISDQGVYYATPDDVRAWLGNENFTDEQLIRPILMAQRDIDAGVGGWEAYEDTGLKFASGEVNDILTDFEARCLRDATCAQVEYRLTMGDDFMVQEQYENRSGRDGSVTGTVRKLSSIAYTELSKAGLLRLWGNVAQRAIVPGENYGDLPRA